MKAMINGFGLLIIFCAPLKGMEESPLYLTVNTEDAAVFPDLQKRIDIKGNVIGAYNGHIYFKPDNATIRDSLELSPNGKRLAYCSNDASGANINFCVYDLKSEKLEISVSPTEQPPTINRPRMFFVDNDIVYLSAHSGFPLYPNSPSKIDSYLYTFFDISKKVFHKIKDETLLRCFAAIPARSILFAASEKAPYQIYALDPKNKILKKTGITTYATPHMQSASDGSLIAIGDFNNIKTYQPENGDYKKVGIWTFSNQITAFAFDQNNRLTVATENGDISVCDPEIKATLILWNLNKIMDKNLKTTKQFPEAIETIRPLHNMIITKRTNPETSEKELHILHADVNQKIENVKKECEKQIAKRKKQCVTT